MSKPSTCQGCPGWAWDGWVPPDGSGRSGVLLLFEAPGEEEAKQGRAMVGRAGALLRRCLSQLGQTREEHWVGNCLWCRPPSNKLRGEPYEVAVLSHCKQHLHQWLLEHRPRVILAGGAIPMEWCFGGGGVPLSGGIQKLRGYTYWQPDYECWVVPTLHPAFILRGNQHLTPVLLRDLWHATEIGKHGYAWDEPDRYVLDPQPAQFAAWVQGILANPPALLAFDIETPDKKADEGELVPEDEEGDLTWTPEGITRIGFCAVPHEPVTIPWLPPYLPFVRQLLDSGITKVAWNKSFDIGKLAQAGFPVKGLVHDGMVAWHVLHSDLPKGLGFVTPFLLPTQGEWKSNPQANFPLYNATDADVELRNTLSIFQQLREQGLWEVYQRDVVELEPILQHMTNAGMPIDAEKRRVAAEQLTTLQEAGRVAMQAVVPDALKGRKIYQRTPKDCTGLVEVALEDVVKRCSLCGLLNPLKPHFKVTKKKVNPCAGGQVVEGRERVQRWARLLPFVPSQKQILLYQKAQRHALQYTQDHQTKERRVTTDKKALERLRASYPDDPLYPLVLTDRKLDKLAGTYVGRLVEGQVVGGLATGMDGRVHPMFTHNPSTLRLSSLNPNMQNLPRTGDAFAEVVRGMFVAPSGSTLWSRDFSAIESVLVGWFAGDRDYVRLSKLGVHAFLTSHLVKRPADVKWSDADLRACFAELKKSERATYELAKRVTYLSLYLGTPTRMHMEYPETFPTVKSAKYYQDIYFDLFPSIRRWQQQLCLAVGNAKGTGLMGQAWGAEPGMLRNPFGYVHRFHAVLEWEKVQGQWVSSPGPDAKRVVAFLPQSTASAILKQAVKRVWQHPEVGPTLRLLVHDEMIGECATRLLDLCLEVSRVEMERPIPELPLDPTWGMGEYLSLGTEAKTGPCWGEMR